jgi:hypothetical protein
VLKVWIIQTSVFDLFWFSDPLAIADLPADPRGKNYKEGANIDINFLIPAFCKIFISLGCCNKDVFQQLSCKTGPNLHVMYRIGVLYSVQWLFIQTVCKMPTRRLYNYALFENLSILCQNWQLYHNKTVKKLPRLFLSDSDSRVLNFTVADVQLSLLRVLNSEVFETLFKMFLCLWTLLPIIYLVFTLTGWEYWSGLFIHTVFYDLLQVLLLRKLIMDMPINFFISFKRSTISF